MKITDAMGIMHPDFKELDLIFEVAKSIEQSASLMGFDIEFGAREITPDYYIIPFQSKLGDGHLSYSYLGKYEIQADNFPEREMTSQAVHDLLEHLKPVEDPGDIADHAAELSGDDNGE